MISLLPPVKDWPIFVMMWFLICLLCSVLEQSHCNCSGYKKLLRPKTVTQLRCVRPPNLDFEMTKGRSNMFKPNEFGLVPFMLMSLLGCFRVNIPEQTGLRFIVEVNQYLAGFPLFQARRKSCITS